MCFKGTQSHTHALSLSLSPLVTCNVVSVDPIMRSAVFDMLAATVSLLFRTDVAGSRPSSPASHSAQSAQLLVLKAQSAQLLVLKAQSAQLLVLKAESAQLLVLKAESVQLLVLKAESVQLLVLKANC